MKAYADFDIKENGRGIIIKKVYNPYYKSKRKQQYEHYDLIYDKEVRKSKEHLTSISGMARDLIFDKIENTTDCSFSALVKRLSNAGIRTYGKVNDIKGGPMGKRKYIWAVKVDNYNKYRKMTKAEETIYNQILEKYASKVLEQSAMLDEAVKAEEALEMQGAYRKFFLIKDATGGMTEHEIKDEQINWE